MTFKALLSFLDEHTSLGLAPMAKRLLLEEVGETLYMKMPAARGGHHARSGGLAEHTLSMMKVAKSLSDHYEALYGYPYFNRELLYTAIALHDIGKVKEMDVRSKDYTTQGKLLGHISLGHQMVSNFIIKNDILCRRLDELYHLILSHHGRLEYGSPVTPKTPEAFLLHQIDTMDAKVDSIVSVIQNKESDSDWTSPKKHIESFYLHSDQD